MESLLLFWLVFCYITKALCALYAKVRLRVFGDGSIAGQLLLVVFIEALLAYDASPVSGIFQNFTVLPFIVQHLVHFGR